MSLRPLALLSLTIAACTPTDDDPIDGATDLSETDDVPAARWPACDPSATSQRLSFVHTNDIHGHYNPDGTGVPAIARARAFYETVKADQPFTLFTNGGDDYEKGSVIEPLSDYAATREIIEAMRFDVRVIGNHDFGWNQEELLRFASDPHAIVLASNIDYIGNDPIGYGAVEYAELQVGCLTLGFMGTVSGPWTAENTPLTGDFYDEFPTNLDFVDAHRRVVAEHRDDVDLLIAVNHIGMGSDLVVAEQVPGIDLILGGHSHTPMFQSETVGDTIVVQSGSYALFVGHLDLTVDLTDKTVTEHTWQLRGLTSDLPVDETVAGAISGILDTYGPNAFDAIGQAKGVGGLGAALLAAKGAMQELSVDAAFMGEHATFNGIAKGTVTQQTLFDAFLIERQPPGEPSWNATYTAQLSGTDLQVLAAMDDTGWAMVVPDAIDPDATYTISLPNYAAQFPQNHLPAGVSLSDVAPAVETWELLEAYAHQRTADCRYLDVDEALEGC